MQPRSSLCMFTVSIANISENPTNESYSVSPTILVAETVVGGYHGETVLLECKVEAWPRAVNYWEKDGRVLAAGPKHKIVEMEESIQYKFV